MRKNVVIGSGIGAVLVAAGVGWIAGRQIRSPAEVASKTAPPAPSVIVAPVEKRALSSEVITRGQVRYGAPQSVSLATSNLKKATNVVSTPPTLGAELNEGSIAMSASGRPVFVLKGDKPAYRDMSPGTSGTDIDQLEKALARLGQDPGPVDGVYDDKTAAAVAAMYAAAGWAPFGPTDEQVQARRLAQTEDFTASSELIAQQEAVETASSALVVAEERVRKATRAIAVAKSTDAAAAAKLAHDRALADAEVATRAAALDTAIDAEGVAKVAVDEAVAGIPAPATQTELATKRAALRQASRAVATARTDLAAAQAGQAAVVAPVANANTADANAELEAANGEVARAQRAVELAQQRLDVANRRATLVSSQANATLGVQIPADEVLFLPNVPLRVDSVKLTAGEPIAGPFMTVTNSRLAIDGSLTLDDSRLVQAGTAVTVTETNLGVKLSGVVSLVASTPGTNGVDANRFHVEVTPTEAPTSLLGASVVLSITVKSTDGEVLALPVSALSVAADGTSRVQVQRKDLSTTYVTVTPGLVSNGFVAVTATSGELNVGDLVIVGSGTGTTTATTAASRTASTASGTTPSTVSLITSATTAKG